MKEKTRQIKFRKTLRKLINRPFHWEQTKKQEEYNMTLQLLVLLSHARVAFKKKGKDERFCTLHCRKNGYFRPEAIIDRFSAS